MTTKEKGRAEIKRRLEQAMLSELGAQGALEGLSVSAAVALGERVWDDLTDQEKRLLKKIPDHRLCDFAIAGSIEHGFAPEFKDRRQAARCLAYCGIASLRGERSFNYPGEAALAGAWAIAWGLDWSAGSRGDDFLRAAALWISFLGVGLFCFLREWGARPAPHGPWRQARRHWPELFQAHLPSGPGSEMELDRAEVWLRSLAARWATPRDLRGLLPPASGREWLEALGCEKELEALVGDQPRAPRKRL